MDAQQQEKQQQQLQIFIVKSIDGKLIYTYTVLIDKSILLVKYFSFNLNFHRYKKISFEKRNSTMVQL